MYHCSKSMQDTVESDQCRATSKPGDWYLITTEAMLPYAYGFSSMPYAMVNNIYMKASPLNQSLLQLRQKTKVP